LKAAAEDVSGSEEYKSNGDPSPIAITEVPFFDVELVGVPALGYVGSQQLVDNPNFKHLMEDDIGGESRVIICGGKGGVGKSKYNVSVVNASMRTLCLLFSNLGFLLGFYKLPPVRLLLLPWLQKGTMSL
jgi:hypothetical protein